MATCRYVDPSTKQEIPSENFVELLVRMNQVLIKLNEKAKGLEVGNAAYLVIRCTVVTTNVGNNEPTS